ncbi:hypothetical protein CY35_05G085600 [Sphagnum magellanicum]|nr:hypothetical protein CY35_05G085600 [Sphagnum magellanicum]
MLATAEKLLYLLSVVSVFVKGFRARERERERERVGVFVLSFFVKETYVVVVVVGSELLKKEEEGDRYLVNGDRDSVLVFRGFLWTTQCAGDSSASHIGSHAEPAFLYSAPLVLGFPLAAVVEEG